MVEVKLKGIFHTFKTLADGTRREYWYFRGEKNIPLHGKPGSPEFMADYQAAQASVKSKDRNRGTFKELIQRFMESPDYLGLSPRTRKDYRYHIAKIETKFGTLPIPCLNEPAIRTVFLNWRDGLAKQSPRQADYSMTVLSRILSWSLDRGYIEFHRTLKHKRQYRSERSEKIWSPEQIRAFLAKATPELKLALVLARDTGQRQGDLLKLRWSEYDGSHIRITQSKTGRKVQVLIVGELKHLLDRERKARAKRGIASTTVLARPDGRPWKTDHFHHEWRRVTLEAGLDGLTFHDLRGTAVTQLAEAGVTVPGIAAVTGHSLKSVESIMEHYLARTKELSDAAILQRENARRTKTANRTNSSANRSKKGN